MIQEQCLFSQTVTVMLHLPSAQLGLFSFLLLSRWFLSSLIIFYPYFSTKLVQGLFRSQFLAFPKTKNWLSGRKTDSTVATILGCEPRIALIRGWGLDYWDQLKLCCKDKKICVTYVLDQEWFQFRLSKSVSGAVKGEMYADMWWLSSPWKGKAVLRRFAGWFRPTLTGLHCALAVREAHGV